MSSRHGTHLPSGRSPMVEKSLQPTSHVLVTSPPLVDTSEKQTGGVHPRVPASAPRAGTGRSRRGERGTAARRGSAGSSVFVAAWPRSRCRDPRAPPRPRFIYFFLLYFILNRTLRQRLRDMGHLWRGRLWGNAPARLSASGFGAVPALRLAGHQTGSFRTCRPGIAGGMTMIGAESPAHPPPGRR